MADCISTVPMEVTRVSSLALVNRCFIIGYYLYADVKPKTWLRPSLNITLGSCYIKIHAEIWRNRTLPMCLSLK